MPIKVAINGFGRIGRTFFRVAEHNPDIEFVALNDLGSPENLAYLLKYDSAYGRNDAQISVTEENGMNWLLVDGRKIRIVNEKDPAKLPWRDMGIDVVVESTGIFDDYEKSKAHLDAGAKRVVITAPVKGEPPAGISAATVLMGLNENKLKTCDISSNASCTTNAASPIIGILHETVGIQKAVLSTVHAYTASQSLVDGPVKDKDFRRGRAAAQNISPSTTGAAVAVTQAYEDLKGKFDGIALRVPVITGSLVDITFLAKRKTSKEEVNSLLKDAAQNPRWSKVFSVTEEQVVSSDMIGTKFASIADLNFTKVIEGDLVKVLAWYDNEMGYCYSLLEHVLESGKNIAK